VTVSTQTVKSQNVSVTSRVKRIVSERRVKFECVCFVRRLYWENYSDYREKRNVIIQLFVYIYSYKFNV
jgi:hypothetical protein